MTHVDDFIDRFDAGKQTPAVKYARWFFHMHRLPAVLQADFKQWLGQYKLFCNWKGKKYRVTGCSRMGDIWLTDDFSKSVGYDHRVDLDECSEWEDK